MNAIADALVILARAALAFVLALGLLAFAIYAAGAHIGHLINRESM